MGSQNNASRRWFILSSVVVSVIGLLALTFWLAQSVPVSARLDQAGVDDARQPASVVADGVYSLTVSVEPDGVPVSPGDVVTYTIEWRRQGGSAVTSGVLTHPMPALVRPLGIDQISLQTVGGVNPQRLRFREGILGWQGQLGPNAGLRIAYPARIQSGYVGPLTATFTANVATTDGFAESASVDTTISGATPVDPDDVVVSLSYVYSVDETPGLRAEALADFDASLVPGAEGFLRLAASNAHTQPVVLRLVGVFPGNVRLNPLRVSNQAGWTGNFAISGDEGSRELSFNIGMPPATTAQFDLPLRLEEDLPPEAELVSQLGYCITDGGPDCAGASPDQPQASPSFQWLAPVTVTVRYRDLGDAPDSSNHAAAAMTAYAGVPADFPTVFDPATGAAQGPAHLNPRPFHLGRRFTPEAEADVGPDMDPTNNILPALDAADRDRYDDGVPAHLLSFQNCQTTTIPVRVAIRPAALSYFQQGDGKGYLNVWLDGNRDGDWADSATCSPVPDQPDVALEHIVIDYEVDVAALGAGLHTLNLPTGRVPWPTEGGQSAWLRVTLSERPSNKPLSAAGIVYGDGRGEAAPFVLGETEDYLYVPQDAPEAGADVMVRQTARWQAAVGDPPSVLAAASPLAWRQRLGTLVIKIDYLNLGNQTAENVTLKSFVNEKLKDALIDVVTLPEVNFGRTVEPEDIFTFDLGDLSPGMGGTAVESVEFKCPPYCCLTCTLKAETGQVADLGLDPALSASPHLPTVRQVFSNVVTIESDNDVNPANNNSQVEQEVLPAPLSLGFTYPGGAYLVRAGTTCNSNSFMLGQTLNRYYLGQSLNVLVDGKQVDTVAIGQDGRFSYTLDLADGWHQVRVALPQDALERATGNDTRPQGPLAQYKYGTAAIRIKVDTSLPWNPISLTFTDEQGNVIRPAGSGAGGQDAGGWTAQLQPGGSYQMSLAYCGADPSPAIRATFADQEVELTDPDEDGVYQGLIVMPDPAMARRASAESVATPLSLSIRTGAVEAVYQGALAAASQGVVYDAVTGEPVAGAQVTVLASDAANPGDGLFDVWPAADYGQTNPQTTGADGALSFWAPTGLYRLSVARDGYQPYQSWDLSVVDTPLVDDLPLTPVVNDPADQVIEVSREGFDPEWLQVEPGTVVRWVNTDVAEHTATSLDPALAGPGTLQLSAWDSGVLGSGAAYTLTFEAEGTYTYGDRANARNTATIQVSSGYRLYLPLVIR